MPDAPLAMANTAKTSFAVVRIRGVRLSNPLKQTVSRDQQLYHLTDRLP